jgi:hypothetical protein
VKHNSLAIWRPSGKATDSRPQLGQLAGMGTIPIAYPDLQSA